MIRRFLLALAFAGSLAAQTFVQMSDTQFGRFTSNQGFEHETANFEFAVAAANRMKPACVLITGDLVNKTEDAAQVAEYQRIEAKLAPTIRVFRMPGNHDVGNSPTPGSLARYRERFGQDYFSFRIGDVAGFILNSMLERGIPEVAQEAAKMEEWFKVELAKARQDGARRLIVFQHHPFFLKDPNEADVYENVPREIRARYLAMLHAAGVRFVFAGHTHNNREARDGDLEMTATSSVGKPSSGAKSGIRAIAVTPTAVTHKFFDFGDLP